MDNDLSGYSVTLKNKKGGFSFSVDELFIHVESDSLEDGYRKLVEKKDRVLAELKENDQPVPPPQTNRILPYSWRPVEVVFVAMLLFGFIAIFAVASRVLQAVEGKEKVIIAAMEKFTKDAYSNLLSDFADRARNVRNLALQKPTRSNRVPHDFPNPGAAVNGVREEMISGIVVFYDPYPSWWEVDLGDKANIERIDIYPGTDNPHYSNSLIVLVSNDEKDWQPVYFRDGKPVGKNEIIRIDLSGSAIEARYVRLQLKEQQTLQVNEVEVWGKISSQSQDKKK